MQWKKMFLVVNVFFFVMCLTMFIFKHRHKDYFSIAKEIVPKLNEITSGDSLFICIVGDSWAYYHKSHDNHL
jgi:hypothetical protein